MLDEASLSAYLTLAFTPRLGAKGLAKLLSHGSPTQLIQRSTQELQALGLTSRQSEFIKQSLPASVERCLTWQQADAVRTILTPLDDSFPPLLKEIPGCPSVLFIEGDWTTLSQPQVALVGSRHASRQGLDHACEFARAFVEQGLTVTSGLALGIDGYAHHGALEGGGKTIAVLGSGLNKVYPARHRELARRVSEQGALVSEFVPETSPRPQNFPVRNRIISGLSAAVLVIEAAEKSGSLITARYAGEQGRDVFALPGPINDPNHRGSNKLIQQGAGLVQSPQELLEEIQTLLDWSIQKQADVFVTDTTNEALPFPELLANVGNEATPVDILACRTNIPVQEVMMQLLELELLGQVEAVAGGYIRKGRG